MSDVRLSGSPPSEATGTMACRYWSVIGNNFADNVRGHGSDNEDNAGDGGPDRDCARINRFTARKRQVDFEIVPLRS